MITCIVPLSRPSMVANVLANFVRQRHVDKRLIVVENGAAVGACAAQGLAADVVLTSEQSPAAAKNAGLAWMRAHGGGIFATFDDDDLYAARYLDEVAEAFEHGDDVVGKSNVFVETSAGNLIAVLGWPENARTGYMVHGPTLCARAEVAVDFPSVMVGEDTAWLHAMRASGATVRSTSRFNFCYRRRRDVAHTMEIDDGALARCWARGGASVFDFGAVAMSTITGDVAVVPERIDVGEYSPMDAPGFVAAAAALGWNPREVAALPVEALP